MNTESSGSESEGENERPQFVSTTPLGEPFMRFQGAYLCNLLKLLNESTHTQMAAVMRWHPKIANALQINWKELNVQFDRVHPILVRYKISRASNQLTCVRPTMNRKLREWNFTMVCDGTPWVSYIYETEMFCSQGLHGKLPAARRRRD